MARKSRLTLWQEHLAEVSRCPKEIFDKIEPNEDTFDTVEMAESGDAQAIRKIVDKLYKAYAGEEELNPALEYFIRLGLEIKDELCARAAIKCFLACDEPIDIVGEAIEILGDSALTYSARVKKIIIDFVQDGKGDEAIKALAAMEGDLADYARIFISGQGAVSNSDGGIEAMARALGLIMLDEWRDFWLKAVYEYSREHLGGELSAIIEKMIAAVKDRCPYPRKKMHLLALTRYAYEVGKASADEYEAIKEECRFDGHEIGTDTQELIKEAVYASSREERLTAKNAARLGAVMRHVKNRYVIDAQLGEHTKRATKHIWKLTLSIESETQKVPSFGILHIDERRYAPMRCGQELEIQRKLSQVICSGEVTVNDRICPIEADLILDITYVSTTKCGSCEIIVKNTSREGKHLVMDCIVMIY